MIYNNVEIFNVEKLRKTPDGSGVILERFPPDVTEMLKGRGSFISRSNTGCEIRFLTTATTVWITMEAMVSDASLTVFLGDFVYQKLTLKEGKKTTIQLTQNECFNNVGKEFMQSIPHRFNHNVWRIYIGNENSHCVFYEANGLDGVVRPPFKNEIPKKRWLAYGSSITHGCWTDDTSNSYINQAARLLGVDVLCKGMSGSCQCEKEMANYLANAKWDFITLELGVNMYGFKTKDFKKRVEYLIETVHEAQPDKKVFVITPFANYNSFGPDKDLVEKHKDYVDILRDIVEKLHAENVAVINGDDILDSYTYFCYDLVHPSEFGHARMGENLYKILKDQIK